VWFEYGQVVDPYGEHRITPDDVDYCLGRNYFAADPIERIAVSFRDLPERVREALEEKRRQADREGWEEIRRGLAWAERSAR
jgi:hypothetical protein